jgi:hypothetical protein
MYDGNTDYVSPDGSHYSYYSSPINTSTDWALINMGGTVNVSDVVVWAVSTADLWMDGVQIFEPGGV